MDNPYRPPAAETADPNLLGPEGAPLPHASPWRRLGAKMVDNFLYFLAGLPFIIGVLASEGLDEDAGTVAMVLSGLLTLGIGLCLFGLTVHWWLKYGQSPGKRLLKLRIVHMNGSQAGASELVIRRFGATFGINVLLAFCGLNGIFNLVDQVMVFSDQNQTIHDRIASTVVVDAEYVPAGMTP